MFRLRGIVRRLRRALPAALALASVVACSLAIPMPVRMEKRASQPFPCQHHACGCRDAESCWRHCCCFSRAEKLAWAESHGVTPPAFVLAAADDGRPSGVCTHSCCAARAHADHEAESAEHAAPDANPNQLVLMIVALRCRGVHVSVTLMPPSLPVERPVFVYRQVERYAAPQQAGPCYEPPYFAVATPPPDSAAA